MTPRTLRRQDAPITQGLGDGFDVVDEVRVPLVPDTFHTLATTDFAGGPDAKSESRRLTATPPRG
jgi:hypothetical protein